MDVTIQQFVKAIHDSPAKFVLVTAGGGAQTLAWLLNVPGASRTLLEALVPYTENSFIEFLGQTPEQFVAATTAGLLAGRALARARKLYYGPDPIIGLACTATIVTDCPKRGEHRAHIATWSQERVVRYYLRLHKGARDRLGEDTLISQLMLQALAIASGLEMHLGLSLLAGDQLETEESDLAAAARRLHHAEERCFGIAADGSLLACARPAAILSGSFNPLHDGHLELARVASELLMEPVIFELAVVNVDKPPLLPPTILERMAQFAGRWTIFASNAPTYVEKARLYPGTTFVVGYDTAVRILEKRYYDHSEAKMLPALGEISRQGCRFLVAGRVDEQGVFHDAESLHIPEAFADLFQSIPAHRFRHDISSTELRQAGKSASR